MQKQVMEVRLNALLRKTFTKGRGRPSKTDEIQIELELRPYFVNSISSYTTAQKTGHDIKTVSRYFNKFKTEMFSSANQEFLERCREQRERSLLGYNDLLASVLQDKKNVEDLIELALNQGQLATADRLYKTKIKLNEQIGQYISAQLELVTHPTADIEKYLRDRGEKLEN
jgi:hypothetical protein